MSFTLDVDSSTQFLCLSCHPHRSCCACSSSQLLSMLKVALLSVIRFPSFVKSMCLYARIFFALDPSSHNSPSKLNRFFFFVSHRLHFVSYYCIDRCANALSSNNTPFQMIQFSTFFSFISMIYFF